MADKIFVIKLGGSIIFPKLGYINTNYLERLKKILQEYINQGNRFILIIGGGAICRWYQDYAKKYLGIYSGEDLNRIGAAVTRANAEVVRSFFGDLAYPENYHNFKRTVCWTQPILVASAWKPGQSTDADAILLAKKFNSQTLMVASNTDYIYTRDPRKDHDVRPLTSLTYDTYQKLLRKITDPTKHLPGAHVPFDVSATRLAKTSGIKVIFLNGENMLNFEKALQGKDFIGTTITSSALRLHKQTH